MVNPEAAKTAPKRPMPDSILEIVQATVDTVKSQKPKPIPGEAKPMTEEMAHNFKNTQLDISEALKPGERFLTAKEANERRKKIIEERKKRGLALQ